jgi:hypothetical protein
MPFTISQRAATTAALTAALVLGSTFGARPAPAVAHDDGHPADANAQGNDETACDQAAAAAEQQLEAAFQTSRHAIEALREKTSEHNEVARDLLRKAAADLKRIFAKAASTLDVEDEDDAAPACTTPDAAALDALVATATTDMAQVVSDVTAAVAALPATQAPADDEDEMDDD